MRRLAGADTSGLSGGTPLATMVTRTGSLDIAATTVADVEVLFASRDDLKLDTVNPNPTMWVEAVLAVPPGTAAPDGLAADLTTALEPRRLAGARGCHPIGARRDHDGGAARAVEERDVTTMQGGRP